MSKHAGPQPALESTPGARPPAPSMPPPSMPPPSAPPVNGTNGTNGTNGHHPTRQLDASPTAADPPPAGREVTCPECGNVARVTVNRRESHDFCASCDFPLFWTPSQVVRDDSDAAAHAALRRLPGTAGRQTVGSLACPVCSEANPITGESCLRCGSDLHPVAPPPAPEPVAPPPPAPEPVKRSIWPWVVLGILTLALVVAVVLVLIYG